MFADFADYHEIFEDAQLKTHLCPSSGCIHSIIALEAICIDVTGKQSIATENSGPFCGVSCGQFYARHDPSLNSERISRQLDLGIKKDSMILELAGSIRLNTRF